MATTVAHSSVQFSKQASKQAVANDLDIYLLNKILASKVSRLKNQSIGRSEMI